MKFFEDNGDFTSFAQSDATELCKCSECQEQFVITEDDDPSECPLCGAKFDSLEG